MSLVLDALRRVERPESQPGTVGVAVSSFRPARRRGNLRFLFFGVIAGALVVVLFGPPSQDVGSQQIPSIAAAPQTAAAPELLQKADGPSPAAAMPASPAAAPRMKASRLPAVVPVPAAAVAPHAFVLQAISERDGHPVAVINDRLVREGDVMDGTLVLRIGSDTVELVLPNGKRGVARFAPPPEGALPD